MKPRIQEKELVTGQRGRVMYFLPLHGSSLGKMKMLIAMTNPKLAGQSAGFE